MSGDSVRAGDAGLTSLGDGSRVSKGSDRVAAYGAVDELDAFTGLARAIIVESVPSSAPRDAVLRAVDAVQNSCWVLAACLAAPGRAPAAEIHAALAELDALAYEISGAVGPLHRFVSPGASRAEASLHVARTVCRRAERQVVALCGVPDDGRPCGEVMILNRVSALLFDAARLILVCQGLEPSLRGGGGSKSR